MPTAGKTTEVAPAWCGHRGSYETLAILCGRGGKGDRLVKCAECGGQYLGSELAELARKDQADKAPVSLPPPGAIANVPAQEGAGYTERKGNMSVPITEPGNAEAKETAPPADNQAVDMGEGHIYGNLTEDPELRFTPTGRPVAKLRVCYRPRIKDPKTDKWHDGEPEFYTLNVWGRQGENTAECFIKGDRIVAAGTWTKRPWITREGERRESVELTVRDIGPSLLFKAATVIRPDNTTEATNDQQ